jgi:hypothetical protein
MARGFEWKAKFDGGASPKDGMDQEWIEWQILDGQRILMRCDTEGGVMCMNKFEECKASATAWRRNPWAAIVIKCEGGFMCFQFVTDAQVWRKQK